jgi:hypothetical protein
LIRETEWLSTLKPEVWRGEALAEHPERLVQALLKVEQAARLAATLELLPKVRNHDQLLKWLRKKLDRTTALGATAQDYLFEMEMAVRLTRAEWLSVSLEEPDIIVTLPSGNSFALACKRPRADKSVGANIDDARDQIARGGHAVAAIVVGMEPILHRPSDPGQCPTIHVSQTREQARAWGMARIAEAAASAAHETERAFECGVLSVVYFGVLVCLTLQPRSYQTLRLWEGVANERDQNGSRFLQLLKPLLFYYE